LFDVRLDVTEITADPRGVDRNALAEEAITLVNRGDRSLDVTGWVLRDRTTRTRFRTDTNWRLVIP